MTFNTDFLMMSTLIKVVLPSETLRICDGGFIVWGAEPDGLGGTSAQTYNSEHADFGTLYTGDGLAEGEGDEAPAASITFLANSNAAVSTLVNPSNQWSEVSMWQSVVDMTTGLVVGVEGLFFGVIDVTTLREGSEGRLLDIDLVSDTERFFMVNEGNRLSQENHQTRYPGEYGLNNMTGVEYDVAWGTESRPRGTGAQAPGYGYGSGSSGGYSGGAGWGRIGISF